MIVSDIMAAAAVAEPMHLEGDEGLPFEEMPNVIVNNTEGFDIETITANYEGPVKLQRLLYVAQHSTDTVHAEALVQLHAELLKTPNISMYKTVCEMAAAANVASIQLDKSWVDNTTKENAFKSEKLESDYRNCTNTSIKESVRRACVELGRHFIELGDYEQAFQRLLRAQDYCGSEMHIVRHALEMAECCVYRQSWVDCSNFSQKVETRLSMKKLNEVQSVRGSSAIRSAALWQPSSGTQTNACESDERPEITTRVTLIRSIAALHNRNYSQVATLLASINPEAASCPNILSTLTAAQYCVLTSMASLSRRTLRDRFASTTFKQLLELDPLLRDILTSFYNSHYTRCFSLMQQARPIFLLDIYLAPHVDRLYRAVRCNALVQYTLPYSVCQLDLMATSFSTTVEDLITELLPLIESSRLSARIDAVRGLLLSHPVDKRTNALNAVNNVDAQSTYAMRLVLSKYLFQQANITTRQPVVSGAGALQNQQVTGILSKGWSGLTNW